MKLRTGKNVPDVSAEQRAADRMRKHLCKLRWIGREGDAERMVEAMRAAGVPFPARLALLRRSLSARPTKDLIA